MIKKPTILQSVIPIVVLIGLILLNVLLAADDTIAGANQLSLLFAAAVASVIAIYNRVSWSNLMKGVLHTLNTAMPAILILMMIGVLSGTWMLSGIIPAMIHYGLYILRPDYFLPAAVVISALISISTGSSWSTIATVGVALLGIGQALGFNEAVVAGAIVSGSYFGDKISPLSDTTNLAAATTSTPLFTHIRYMLYTTVPTIIITLILFVIISFTGDQQAVQADITSVQTAIMTHYNITPWLFIVPVIIIVMIAKKMPPAPALLIGGLLGGVFAIGFQPQMIASLSADNTLSISSIYQVITRAMYGSISLNTGDEIVNSLFSSGGMAGMMNTVWLIITAMIFGGIMEAGHFLERLTGAIIKRVSSVGGLVTTTAASCVLFNATAGDQYMAIVIPGKMFSKAFRKKGVASEVLSRTLEDAGTATSVLIPWNSCGATQAGVLGVATFSYLPYAFFCYISPLMTILYAWLNIKIRKVDPSIEQNSASPM